MRFRPISRLVCGLYAVLSLLASGCGKSSGSQAVASASPSAPVASSAQPQHPPIVAMGEKLYEQYCALCHAKDGTGYAADNAPSLVSKTYLESSTDEMIAAGIRMGRPGTAMAAYGAVRGGPLQELQIRAIAAYLRTKGPQVMGLPPFDVTGNAVQGGPLYEKNCASCHGTVAARGNALSLFNPELLNLVSPSFMHYAIMNGRPPTPMPAFYGKLSDQESADIIAWLLTFKPAAPTPPVLDPSIPADLPIVINPKGARPKFTLREDRFVSSEQVKKALDAKQRIVIIDARAPSDWIQFHIPGSISLPYHDKSHLERVPNDNTWVVAYCACPHHASGEVVDALRGLKYTATAVLDEGILFWRDKGYPLAGEAVKSGAASAKPGGGLAPLAPASAVPGKPAPAPGKPASAASGKPAPAAPKSSAK